MVGVNGMVAIACQIVTIIRAWKRALQTGDTSALNTNIDSVNAKAMCSVRTWNHKVATHNININVKMNFDPYLIKQWVTQL